MGRLLEAGRPPPPGGGAGSSTRALIHSAAEVGVGGPAGPLPFARQIQSAFGRHDVSKIKAHTGAAARQATRAMGVDAYAKGNHVVFGKAPSLFVAAHEATHVIQQQGGVQLLGGVGRHGDRYEAHANAVAQRVVDGGSAEALLDRHAPSPTAARSTGAGAASAVQFWGEPDHYMLNQLAGQKAMTRLRSERSVTGRTYDIGGDRDPSRPLYAPEGDEIKKSEDQRKFFLRDDDGGVMSYGAAGRFAGDLGPTATGSPTRGKSLEGWLSEVKSKGDEYLGLSLIVEGSLLATNASHFYPLAGVEYRRNHQKALQMIWMARELRAAGRTKEAAKMAQQGILHEAFASHFLADCFAAGHLSPHALGRVDGDKASHTTGARVNTWHDLLNALPDGVPTTLGRFHGDYSMDAHDLGYISTVISESLLEVALPWFADIQYTPHIVLPEPDLPRIMEDPVVGPIWAQMCGDYHKDLLRLADKKRRPGKHDLSKHAIYQTTADSQVSNEELIPDLMRSVFAGDKVPKVKDTTGGDLKKIQQNALAIVIALEQIFDYREGLQTEAKLTKDFEPSEHSRHETHKFRLDLKSAKLAKISDATSPIHPMCEALAGWVGAWGEKVGPIEETEARELRHLLRGLALATPDKVTDDHDEGSVRRDLLFDLRKAISLFDTIGVSKPTSKRSFYLQGPERALAKQAGLKAFMEHGTPMPDLGPDFASSSDKPVSLNTGAFSRLRAAAHSSEQASLARAILGVLPALNMLVADPRPASDAQHTLLYEMVQARVAKAREVLHALASVGERALSPLGVAYNELELLEKQLAAHYKTGRKSVTETGRKKAMCETARREILASLVKDLAPYYTLNLDVLRAATGWAISVD